MIEQRYELELEPEVRLWLANLPAADYLRVEKLCDVLSENAETLGEPYTRHLGGKLRELRFTLRTLQMRITYWLAPERRIVMLTVFRKTKARETSEVERAHRAQAACEQNHPQAGAHEIYDRYVKEEEL